MLLYAASILCNTVERRLNDEANRIFRSFRWLIILQIIHLLMDLQYKLSTTAQNILVRLFLK